MRTTNDPFQNSLNQLTEAATARQDWDKCPPTHEVVRAELERRRVENNKTQNAMRAASPTGSIVAQSDRSDMEVLNGT